MTDSQNTILFFDLDGTLMVNPFKQVVFPTIAQKIANAARRSIDVILDEIMAEHDFRLEHPLADRPRTMDWEDIFQTIADRYAFTLTDSAEALVIQHAAPPYTRTLDTAPEVLQQLRVGRQLVAASMGLAKYQIPVLKGLGLYDYFDDFLMPDTTGYLKTDQEFFARYSHARLRIHIGDRYDHDCFFPKQYGILSVMRLPLHELAALPPLERPRQLLLLQDKIFGTQDGITTLPDAVVVHLAELPAVIEQLETQ